MSKASRLVQQLETQLEQARAALKKKDKRLKMLSEQLRGLGERYKKMGREREYLALNAAYGCHAYGRYAVFAKGCSDCPVPYKRCCEVTKDNWIDAAERQAAKEATSHVNKL